PLKAGLIGCGGRGSGAAVDFLKAGPNLKITAMADMFEDHMKKCREHLAKEADLQVPDDRCFLGFDAYKKVIDSDVDIIILATPPHFRPEHFNAAVDSKKHIFMEKPVAVDAPGIRTVLGAGEKAKQYNLCVVAGTQRRHQPEYVETQSRVANGAIGKVVAARGYWNGPAIWRYTKQKGWSDMEAMLRDWVNWCWLSGDHIVEQHVHNLDVMAWFSGLYPGKAVGMGSRQRRVTGDQFDNFAVDYVFADGMHALSMCRQIDGCANDVSEFVVGSEGLTNCRNTIYDLDGKAAWKYGVTDPEELKRITLDHAAADQKPWGKVNPYEQEHVDLVTAIRTSKPINETEDVAKSTLMAIMGRMAAYTGTEITWEQAMSSEERLGPTEYKMGPVTMKVQIPVAGIAPKAAQNA
ncbi:MAG: Gfo/Idh/MocA family oxidoreductase, partial [Acidobacteria bacterium]|nr:Gfo/Idh/MocA family oxidoreductase [Acidobacteriota bacterium]